MGQVLIIAGVLIVIAAIYSMLNSGSSRLYGASRNPKVAVLLIGFIFTIAGSVVLFKPSVMPDGATKQVQTSPTDTAASRTSGEVEDKPNGSFRLYNNTEGNGQNVPSPVTTVAAETQQPSTTPQGTLAPGPTTTTTIKK